MTEQGQEMGGKWMRGEISNDETKQGGKIITNNDDDDEELQEEEVPEHRHDRHLDDRQRRPTAESRKSRPPHCRCGNGKERCFVGVVS